MYRVRAGTTLAYLTPMIVGVGLISFYPILYNIFISGTNQNLYHFRHYSFVGLTNYQNLLKTFDADFFIVVILGALQSSPSELYEAAAVDGAGAWRKFWRITLPLLRPAILPATVLSAILTFNTLNTAYLITTGGPFVSAAKPGATEFVMVYAFREAFQLFNFGYIAAFAVVIFAMLFGVTLGSLRFSGLVREEAR